jgi:hydroxymethylglutaryl-CoA lyase
MTRVHDLYPRDTLVIREVGFRDGLQLVTAFPRTDDKRAWLDIDYRAGLRHFEIGSFLPPARYPQFADIDAMIAAVKALPGAYASALVLNRKGGQNALASDINDLVCVVSASEAHNLANARRSREHTLLEIEDICAMRRDSDKRPVITVAIPMAYGCSIAGKDMVRIADVLGIAERCLAAGADAISIADTVGYGGPSEVTAMLKAARSALGDVPVVCHFHDTRGLGIANVAAALDAGARIIDASLGGLGGCPFAPNATGNVVLEDVVFLARSMGFPALVDPMALMPARAILSRTMPDEALYGQLARAGLPHLAPA